MKEYDRIGTAYQDLKDLKEKYDQCRKYQTQLKMDYNNWPGPPESYSKRIWEDSISEQIGINREELRDKENQIKELRKIIKKMNREQNLKNNKRNS